MKQVEILIIFIWYIDTIEGCIVSMFYGIIKNIMVADICFRKDLKEVGYEEY